MSDVLKALGVDVEGLGNQLLEVPEYPKVVEGRIAHIDADFIAYQASAEKADDPKTWEDVQHNVQTAIDHMTRLAGAEANILHLTPKGSTKGGRREIAILKEYQANREGKEKPPKLEQTREWMGAELGAKLWATVEADDGMSIFQTKMIEQGRRDKSVIVSQDKDLMIVEGLHCNPLTGEFIDVDGWGHTELVAVKRTNSKGKEVTDKKVVGHGTSFFWWQVLMGDAADNISGLPRMAGADVLRYKPTQSDRAAMALLNGEKKATSLQIEKAQNLLDNRKSLQCGQVLVAEVLSSVRSDAEAFNICKSLYANSAESEPFRHWSTGEQVAWGAVLISEMKLLWMRRYSTADTDVMTWLKGAV